MTVETDELLLDLAARYAAGETPTPASGSLASLDAALARMLGEGAATLRDVTVATPTAALADVLAGLVASAPQPWPARLASTAAGLGLAAKVALGAGVAVAALGVAHQEHLLPAPLDHLLDRHLGGSPDRQPPAVPASPSGSPSDAPGDASTAPGESRASRTPTPTSPDGSTPPGPRAGATGSGGQGGDPEPSSDGDPRGAGGADDGGAGDGSDTGTNRDSERPDPSESSSPDGSGDPDDATEPSDPDPAEPSDPSEPSDPLETAGADGGSSDRDVAGQRIRVSWNDSPSSET